jgi:hypothetical protein
MIRVTKWLGDIPVEATFTACSTVSFSAEDSTHRPNREEYRKSLQAQFDEHCNATAVRLAPAVYRPRE